MIRCKEVATLLDTDELQRMGTWKRLQVRLHLAMCRHCSLFARQIQQLRSAARGLRAGLDAEKPATDLPARLARKLGLKKE